MAKVFTIRGYDSFFRRTDLIGELLKRFPVDTQPLVVACAAGQIRTEYMIDLCREASILVANVGIHMSYNQLLDPFFSGFCALPERSCMDLKVRNNGNHPFKSILIAASSIPYKDEVNYVEKNIVPIWQAFPGNCLARIGILDIHENSTGTSRMYC